MPGIGGTLTGVRPTAALSARIHLPPPPVVAITPTVPPTSGLSMPLPRITPGLAAPSARLQPGIWPTPLAAAVAVLGPDLPEYARVVAHRIRESGINLRYPLTYADVARLADMFPAEAVPLRKGDQKMLETLRFDAQTLALIEGGQLRQAVAMTRPLGSVHRDQVLREWPELAGVLDRYFTDTDRLWMSFKPRLNVDLEELRGLLDGDKRDARAEAFLQLKNEAIAELMSGNPNATTATEALTFARLRRIFGGVLSGSPADDALRSALAMVANAHKLLETAFLSVGGERHPFHARLPEFEAALKKAVAVKRLMGGNFPVNAVVDDPDVLRWLGGTAPRTSFSELVERTGHLMDVGRLMAQSGVDARLNLSGRMLGAPNRLIRMSGWDGADESNPLAGFAASAAVLYADFHGSWIGPKRRDLEVPGRLAYFFPQMDGALLKGGAGVFHGTTLTGVNFSGTEMTGVDLSGATVVGSEDYPRVVSPRVFTVMESRAVIDAIRKALPGYDLGDAQTVNAVLEDPGFMGVLRRANLMTGIYQQRNALLSKIAPFLTHSLREYMNKGDLDALRLGTDDLVAAITRTLPIYSKTDLTQLSAADRDQVLWYIRLRLIDDLEERVYAQPNRPFLDRSFDQQREVLWLNRLLLELLFPDITPKSHVATHNPGQSRFFGSWYDASRGLPPGLNPEAEGMRPVGLPGTTSRPGPSLQEIVDQFYKWLGR